MKKAVPFGWPKRDPRRYRFALPNQVWSFGLRPVEFMVLAYLCYRHHNQGVAEVDAKVISSYVGKSVRTVKTCLTALAEKGAIVSAADLTPTFPLELQAHYFTLPNEIFLLTLPPSAFAVYAYLLCREDRRSYQCRLSFTTISAETHMAVNTAQHAVSTLVDKGLITVEHTRRSWHGKKVQGSNLYTVLPVDGAVDSFHVQQMRAAEFETRRRRALKLLESAAPPVPPDKPDAPLPAA